MKTELEKILVEKYPTLFKNYHGDPKVTCMSFGIETNDGWYSLLDHLFGYLTNLMETKLVVNYTNEYRDKHKDKKDFYTNYHSYKFLPPQIILDQVKEKFGTLRVYYHTYLVNEVPADVWGVLNLEDYYKKLDRYNDKIDFAISYAEYQSSVTCEVTGKEGKLYAKGWHQTLCEEEAKKQNRNADEATTLNKTAY
jgi:hypothetical protein